MTPWWVALAPVTLPVACGDDEHQLHWAAGTLTAPAHPDADRERALAALGAEPSACLQILDAWNRHADDLDVFMLASRGPSDPLDEFGLDFANQAGGIAHFGRYRPLPYSRRAYASSVTTARPTAVGWAAYSPMPMRYADPGLGTPSDELPRLLLLGGALSQRLVATVIATWAQRIDAGDERVATAMPALDAALYGRLRATLLSWLGNRAQLDFTLQPSGAEPMLRRDGDLIHAELPFAWLRDVWANGLAVILDRFCVQAHRTAQDTWTLTTVDRKLSSPQTVTISG